MFLHTLSCPQTTGWKYSKSSTIIPAYTKKSLKRLHFKDLYFIHQIVFAVRTGLEPVTPCVTGMYSNQLN